MPKSPADLWIAGFFGDTAGPAHRGPALVPSPLTFGHGEAGFFEDVLDGSAPWACRWSRA